MKYIQVEYSSFVLFFSPSTLLFMKWPVNTLHIHGMWLSDWFGVQVWVPWHQESEHHSLPFGALRLPAYFGASPNTLGWALTWSVTRWPAWFCFGFLRTQQSRMSTWEQTERNPFFLLIIAASSLANKNKSTPSPCYIFTTRSCPVAI